MKNVVFNSLFKELSCPQSDDSAKDTSEYRTHLFTLYFEFKNEINQNIQEADNLYDALDYLNDLLICFKPLETILENNSAENNKTRSITVLKEGFRFILYLIRKKKRLLKYKINHLHGFDGKPNKNRQVVSRFYWLITDTALIELSVGLARVKAVGEVSGREATPKEIAEELSRTFGLKLEYIDSKLSKAKNRKKDSAPFLTQLKNSFDIYMLDDLEK